jgi:hypothetical protein
MGVAILTKKSTKKFKKLANESKYNNGLIAKLVCIFANIEERREEREELYSHAINKLGMKA